MQAALSTYQMQILDCISRVDSESEMIEMRNMIAEYFSNKALNAMDKLCDVGKLSTDVIQSWSKDHDRIPYKS